MAVTILPVAPTMTPVGAAPKVMVCGVRLAGPTAKLCWTWSAGAYVPLPAWSAAIVQVPTVRSVRAPVSVPTVQTNGVVEL